MVADLRDIKEVLDKHGIEYWLDWGTLLGAVREGKIIEWDPDMELGMMESEFKKIEPILPEIEEKGFEVHKIALPICRYSFKRSPFQIDTWSYTLLDKDNYVVYPFKIPLSNLRARFLWYIWLPFICAEKNIDLKKPYNRKRLVPHDKFKLVVSLALKYFLVLFPYQIRKALAEAALGKLMKDGQTELIKAIVPRHFFEKFKKTEFYGMTFNIPFETEEYIEYKYGKDWRVPKNALKGEWTWYKDDGSVINH